MVPPPTFELPVHDSKGTAGDEDDEPEPENEENLLVHNVQREKAHGVKFLRETFYHQLIRFLSPGHLRQLVRWNCE